MEINYLNSIIFKDMFKNKVIKRQPKLKLNALINIHCNGNQKDIL